MDFRCKEPSIHDPTVPQVSQLLNGQQRQPSNRKAAQAAVQHRRCKACSAAQRSAGRRIRTGGREVGDRVTLPNRPKFHNRGGVSN